MAGADNSSSLCIKGGEQGLGAGSCDCGAQLVPGHSVTAVASVERLDLRLFIDTQYQRPDLEDSLWPSDVANLSKNNDGAERETLATDLARRCTDNGSSSNPSRRLSTSGHAISPSLLGAPKIGGHFGVGLAFRAKDDRGIIQGR